MSFVCMVREWIEKLFGHASRPKPHMTSGGTKTFFYPFGFQKVGLSLQYWNSWNLLRTSGSSTNFCPLVKGIYLFWRNFGRTCLYHSNTCISRYTKIECFCFCMQNILSRLKFVVSGLFPLFKQSPGFRFRSSWRCCTWKKWSKNYLTSNLFKFCNTTMQMQYACIIHILFKARSLDIGDILQKHSLVRTDYWKHKQGTNH